MRKAHEKDFKNFVLEVLKNYGWDCTKVETGATKLGVADVYCLNQHSRRSMWIEFKSTPKIPVEAYRSGSRMLPLRPGQERFLQQCARSGVDAYVLLEARDGYLAVPALSISNKRVLPCETYRAFLKTVKYTDMQSIVKYL
jgi:hypothetical protein